MNPGPPGTKQQLYHLSYHPLTNTTSIVKGKIHCYKTLNPRWVIFPGLNLAQNQLGPIAISLVGIQFEKYSLDPNNGKKRESDGETSPVAKCLVFKS